MSHIDASTKLLGLFADPSHLSRAPGVYNQAFIDKGINMAYLAFTVNEGTIEHALQSMRCLGMIGANLSMPNKIEAMRHLDEIDDEARLIGAVNCIVNTDGILKGYNTDGRGFLSNLESNDINVKDKNVVLLGFGGAGAAIAVTCALQGANLTVLNRLGHNFERAVMVSKELSNKNKMEVVDYADIDAMKKCLDKADIVINATNIGFTPYEDMMPLPNRDFLRKEMTVVDIIYNPKETLLLKTAREIGCKVLNGEGMWLHQADMNFKLWTGQSIK